MKHFIYLLLITVICSCNVKEYKYKIEGKVNATVNTGDFLTGYKPKDIVADAIAYTDTIHGSNEDSIWYYNSDGSITTILAPYNVYLVK